MLVETALLNKVATELSLPAEDLMRKSLVAFLREQLRFYDIERLSLCQKYGVSSLSDMDQLIIQGQAEEGAVLEGFQRVDFVTHQIRMISHLLGELDGGSGARNGEKDGLRLNLISKEDGDGYTYS